MKFFAKLCVILVLLQIGWVLGTHGPHWLGSGAGRLACLLEACHAVVGHVARSHGQPAPGAGHDWIVNRFRDEGIAFEDYGTGWRVDLPTRQYTNHDDQTNLMLLVFPGQQPHALTIFAPYLYTFETDGSDERIPLLPALQYSLDWLQIDYDPRDGEVRGTIRLIGVSPASGIRFETLFRHLRDDVEILTQMIAHQQQHSAIPQPRQRREGSPARKQGMEVIWSTRM